jgi:two-component sensor histidine kinase
MQTLRHADNLQDFGAKFQARLLAVARAHDLLTRRHWENAPLESLAGEVLAPLTGAAQPRVTIDGPYFDVSPRAALSLTMAFSELATNAVKHGALASENGTLSLQWHLRQEPDGQVLSLHWQERGGAPVMPPARRGFGMRLMERCIEADLRGVFDLVFEPQGVSCRMLIPVASCATHE